MEWGRGLVCGNGGVGVCGQTVEDGYSFLLMLVRGSVGDGEPLRGWNGQPWEYVSKTNGVLRQAEIEGLMQKGGGTGGRGEVETA